MARAIVRHSLEAGHVPQRNRIRNALEDAGFQKIGTSSYEADAVDTGSIIAALQVLLTQLDQLPDGAIDHLWIYLDLPGQEVIPAPDPN